MEKVKLLSKLFRSILRSRLFIIGITLFSYVVVALSGGTPSAMVHLFYVPIIISSRKGNLSFTVLICVLSGLLTGPLMLFYKDTIEMSIGINWVVRLFAFLTVGSITTILFKKSSDALAINNMIIHTIPSAICVVELDGTIVYCNSKCNQFSDSDVVFNKNSKVLDVFKQIISETDNYQLKLDELENVINRTSEKTELKMQVQINGKHATITIKSMYSIYNEKDVVFLFMNDIKQKVEFETQLNIMKSIDSLTSLKNRQYFEEQLKKLYEDKDQSSGLVICDIDGTKYINDSFGFQSGNELIIRVATILKKRFKSFGTVCRLDGDEFGVVIKDTTNLNLEQIIRDVKKEVNNIKFGSNVMSLSCGYRLLDYVKSYEDLLSQIENSVIIEKNSTRNSLRTGAVETIMNTLFEKDQYSEKHSEDVSIMSSRIAELLNLSLNDVNEITNAALLHDIGKIIVPIDILTKKGRLTDTEYAKMKEHTLIGYRLLQNMRNLNDIPKIVLSHHERFDGKGYPNGITGLDIPLGSRIISVADSYNAMTTSRPYRNALEVKDALNELKKGSKTQFDPEIVEFFIDNFNTITDGLGSS